MRKDTAKMAGLSQSRFRGRQVREGQKLGTDATPAAGFLAAHRVRPAARRSCGSPETVFVAEGGRQESVTSDQKALRNEQADAGPVPAAKRI
jgi:hypothetical protein